MLVLLGDDAHKQDHMMEGWESYTLNSSKKNNIETQFLQEVISELQRTQMTGEL